MILIYDFVLFLYSIILYFASFFNPKAKLIAQGRTETLKLLKSCNDTFHHCIYFHVASLGEFEQARPLIEKMRKQYPEKKIVISFYSPSGYEVRKNYKQADLIIYLPLDTKKNAQTLWETLNPSIIIWVKYEFWHHYLEQAKKKHIPLLLICGAFRQDHIFFKWYGGFFRNIISFFDGIYVQNESSKKLLSNIHINSEIAYDTRFDRVYEIANEAASLRFIEQFKEDKKCLVFGSTWPKDEKIIHAILPLLQDYKIIIAPHNIDKKHIVLSQQLFQKSTILYSQNNQYNGESILIIDNIGMLSSLYQYADIAYIGGGFDVSVHNILEAAVYGIPVICGPNNQKSIEAQYLKKQGSLIEIKDVKTMLSAIELLFSDHQRSKKMGEINQQYVKQHLGGTEKIMTYIENNI